MPILHYHKILLFAMFLSPVFSFGQEDALSVAKELNRQYKFIEAEKILDEAYRQEPNDLYIGWLYAHTLHQNGDFDKSIDVYNKVIILFPDNIELKLDRINKLTVSGDFSNAIISTENIIDDLADGNKYSAYKTLSLIYFWKGDYDQSLKEIDKAFLIKNDEPSAILFRNNIVDARSNWAGLDVKYGFDEQPLASFIPTLSAGYYVNSNLSLQADLTTPIFAIDDENFNAQWLNVATKYKFIEQGLSLDLNVGAFNHDDLAVTGGIKLNKKLLKYLTISVEIDKKPFLATTFAAKNKIMMTIVGAEVNWNNTDGILGQALVRRNYFQEQDKYFTTYGGWLVLPAYNVKDFEFRFGYGINYSDSKTDVFSAVDSLSTIIADWDSTYVIEGSYDPFYSPNDQIIHSLVGIVTFSPNDNLSLKADVNYGIRATTNTPILFLDINSNKEIFVNKNFFVQSYHPLDLNVSVNYKFSRSLSMMAFYKYQKTFFYENNVMGISTKLLF